MRKGRVTDTWRNRRRRSEIAKNGRERRKESVSDVGRMPFGKHRGQPLRSVPRDYLEWVMRAVEGFDDLKRSITVVLAEWDWTRTPKPAAKPRPKHSRKPHAASSKSSASSPRKRTGPLTRDEWTPFVNVPASWLAPDYAECPFDAPDDLGCRDINVAPDSGIVPAP